LAAVESNCPKTKGWEKAAIAAGNQTPSRNGEGVIYYDAVVSVLRGYGSS
jgi:hypothetical protein